MSRSHKAGRNAKTALGRELKQMKDDAKFSLHDESAKLIRHLHDIPERARNQLSAKFYPEMGVAQVFYRKHLEGSQTPNNEASHERGKIYDMRNGRAICGGSSYTHLAIAEDNQLKIVDGKIVLHEIDSDGNPTGQTFRAPLPYRSVTDTVIPHKVKIEDFEYKLAVKNDELTRLNYALGDTMVKINSFPPTDNSVELLQLKEQYAQQQELISKTKNERTMIRDQIQSIFTLSNLNIFIRYRILLNDIEFGIPGAEEDLEILEQFLQSIVVEPSTLEYNAANGNRDARRKLEHIDEYNELRQTYPRLSDILGKYLFIINNLNESRVDLADAIRYADLFPDLIQNEKVREFEALQDEVSELENKARIFVDNVIRLLFNDTIADDAEDLQKEKDEENVVSGNNLAISSTIAEQGGSFIRYYAEGTHVYIYKFNGEVLMASHKNARAGYYDENGIFTGKAKFRGITFASMYKRIGGPDPKSLFPETCLTSPYVYRFLICTRENSFATRYITNDRGYLVFIGVQKMWNYGAGCPYDYGMYQSGGRYAKPFAGTKDDRTEEELLAIGSKTTLPVHGSHVDSSVNPYIYFPRSSRTIEDANELLSRGLGCTNVKYFDHRLGEGESIMISYFDVVDGKKYIRNIKLMSQSYYFRLSIHNEPSNILNLRYYALNAEKPDYVPNEAPAVIAYNHESYKQSFIDPFMIKDELMMLYCLTEVQVDENVLHPAYKRLMAATLYIWSANPALHMSLVADFMLFLEDIQSLCVWIASYITIERPEGDSDTSKLLSKITNEVRHNSNAYLSHLGQQGHDIDDDLAFNNAYEFAINYVYENLNYIECGNLVSYMLTTFENRQAAIDFFEGRELRPDLQPGKEYIFKERKMEAVGYDALKGTISLSKAAQLGSKKCTKK